jgi:dolichol-phosphate mannosyltransferase
VVVGTAAPRPAMKKVSVVVPVYYNQASLQPLMLELAEVEQQLAVRGMELELIFVDDGSGDDSLQELLKIKLARPQTKVIKLARNFGAVHASKTGFHFVTGDCFLILAADLQDPPELILEMVDHWLNGAKFIICARQDREDPYLSKFYAKIYYLLLRAFVVRNYPPSGFDLACMDRVFLPYLQNSSKNINTPLFAYWLGFTPKIIHYHRRKRVYGKSRWTLSKRVTFFLDSLLGFSVLPIRLISSLGLIISTLSFLYGLNIVINTLEGRRDVQGFATIVALNAFLFGLVIVMLGVIGEYVWRIFDEINRRPEVVIDEIY